MSHWALDSLRNSAPVILPSLLQCDFGNLAREVSALEEAEVRGLHLDVMDGHFVPNLTYGMPVVAGLRRLTKLPLDVHLMISQPRNYLKQFKEAGADILTVHAEVDDDLPGLLQEIRSLGCAAGVALNPQTPVSQIADYLPMCDVVLPMSVPAGFGGQPFDPIALEKLRQLRKLAPHAFMEVDGGINTDTIRRCAEAGAQGFVVGSAIFKSTDYRQSIAKLLDEATPVT